LFVLFETWLVPIEGWFVDKYGPKVVVFIGGVLCGIGWVMSSYATSLTEYYIAQIIAGIGAGAVYGTSIGNALKWFPDKRGLAAGITAAGFGAGSALTVVPIQKMIADGGFQATFFYFGIGQGAIVCIVALILFAPKPGQVPAVTQNANVLQSRRNFEPTEIIGPTNYWIIGSLIALVAGLAMWAIGQLFYVPLMLAILIFSYGGYVVWTRGQPVFTLMYFMFVMVGAGGLMVTANLAPISQDLKVATTPVTLMWLTMPALTFAATIDRILNGLTRPFFGWVSDHIGRENTMFIAFFVEGLGIYALLYFAENPILFVILSGLVFFAWGEIYSLFPATCTDIYGRKFATTNYGMLYTAKGAAALLVPLANLLTTTTGSCTAAFVAASALNIVAATLALAALKPMRMRAMANEGSTPAYPGAS
jgi:OFA family oxalate/formate antiporter-like MFS transporter